MNSKYQNLLISLSDNDSDEYIKEYLSSEESDNDENSEKAIYLIRNENLDSENPKISEFLKFCIHEGLFDNTFYDWHNSFSVFATKLPKTFEKLSGDNNGIQKKNFITKFKKDFGFSGDINFIYNCLDSDKKGFITCEEFIDFFLPYIQYVTV